MERSERIRIWLRNVVLLLSAVLIGLMCVFMWRLSRTVLQIERTVTTISADVTKVASTAGQLADKVEGVGNRLSAIERGAEDMLFTAMLAGRLSGPGVASVGEEPAPLRDARAQEEINYLLQSCIGRPDLSYEYEGKHRSAEWVRSKLALKYLAYQNVVASAEDFINKVTTRTHKGAIYYVITDAGEKKELGPWLMEQLADYRNKSTTGEPAK